jgi:hypothetical protein
MQYPAKDCSGKILQVEESARACVKVSASRYAWSERFSLAVQEEMFDLQAVL